MPEFADQTIKDDEVMLAGNVFRNVRFENCRIHITNGPINCDRCVFRGCVMQVYAIIRDTDEARHLLKWMTLLATGVFYDHRPASEISDLGRNSAKLDDLI
jgi:hypothetical protein